MSNKWLCPAMTNLLLNLGCKALASSFSGLHSIKFANDELKSTVNREHQFGLLQHHIKLGVCRVRSGTPMPSVLQSLHDK